MTKRAVIDDNDILEIQFLDKKVNRIIAFIFGGLILMVVIVSGLSSFGYDASKGMPIIVAGIGRLSKETDRFIFLT